MKITIATSFLETFIYDVDESATINSLKNIINSEKTEWPVECMKLVGDDIVFNDNSNIGDYNIDENTNIRLIIQPITLETSTLQYKYKIDPQLNQWYYN